MNKPLEAEIHTYHNRLNELLEHSGRYVLIKGNTVVTVMDTYNDALKLGYERFGLEPFFVGRIQPPEHAAFISREVVSCPL